MILDYIWKSLFLGALSATVYLSIMIVASGLMKRSTAVQMKWYFNSQIIILFAILTGGFFVAAADHQLLTGCFDKFVQQSTGWIVTRWLAGGWLVGFMTLACRDVLRAVIIAKRIRRLNPSRNDAVISTFQELKVQFRVRGPVEVYEESEIMSPFAFGIFSHKIVVPKIDFAESTLRSALAHELVHVRDRDSFWLTTELFCRRVLFWHPLAYVFARIYSACVEKAADESAVSGAGIKKRDFLTALIDLAALAAKGSSSPLQLHASRGFRETKARIEYLLIDRPAKAIWSIPMFILIFAAPFAVSFAQAGAVRENKDFDPKMCLQLNHEKIIESWLRIEPAPAIKCGK